MIPVYGAYEKLSHVVNALYVQGLLDSPNVNVYLVDDAYKTPMPYNAKAHNLVNTKNLGFAQTCNVGAKAGKAPVIAFLNSDMVPAEGWHDIALEILGQKDVGVVGGLLTFPADIIGDSHRPAGTVQHAGIMFGTNQVPKHRCVGWKPDNPRVQLELVLQAVTGAFMVTSRRLFETIGGFWPGYGSGTFEDTEYCIQARLLNKLVVYTPKMKGVHYTGGSKTEFPLQRNYQIFRERVGKHVSWDEWALP